VCLFGLGGEEEQRGFYAAVDVARVRDVELAVDRIDVSLDGALRDLELL